MRRISVVLAAVCAGLVSLAAAASADAASRGPCIPGTKAPLCHLWDAKVTFVADGDTIQVDVLGDGSPAIKAVRFTGINAMEQSRYSKYPDRRRGACHALEATALAERYIKRSKWRVRLAAQSKNARTGHRLRRSVFVKVDGRWQDLARILIAGGHALWLPNGGEWAHNAEYHLLAQRAAAAQMNLWDPDYCGAGPSPDAPLSVSVNWDANGSDSKFLNGEWIDVRNFGAVDVPVGGWWIRDSFLRPTRKTVPGYELPPYAVVPAGGKLRLYVGCGPSSPAAPSTHYWCQGASVFENVSYDKRAIGDGAYLFDPEGDLRAFASYPCLESCADPMQGRVRLRVVPNGPDERFEVSNVGDGPIDLDGYVVKLHLQGRGDKFIFSHGFGRDAQLGQGETLTIHMDGSPSRDDRLTKYLGRGPYVLADGGNAVSVRTTSDIVIACDAWGRAHC